MYFLFHHTVAQKKRTSSKTWKVRILGTSISFASPAMWRCLNLKENNLPSVSQSLKEKFILQSLLNIIYTTPQVRLARLWQALENNRHCLLLKQRVTTPVLCVTKLAACSHLHLTGAVTNGSLLITVSWEPGIKDSTKHCSHRWWTAGPTPALVPQSSCGMRDVNFGPAAWGLPSNQGSPLPPSAFPLFSQPLLGGLWTVRDPELTEMHHALSF